MPDELDVSPPQRDPGARPREWLLGALYLPVYLYFLNLAILTYFPALGFPLTELRNYFLRICFIWP